MNWFKLASHLKVSQIAKDPSGSIVVTIPANLFALVYDSANFYDWDDIKEDRHFDIDKNVVDYDGIAKYEKFYMQPMQNAIKNGDSVTVTFQNDAAFSIFEEALFDEMESAVDNGDKKTMSAIRSWMVSSGMVVPYVKPEAGFGSRPDFKYRGKPWMPSDERPYSSRQRWPEDPIGPPGAI